MSIKEALPIVATSYAERFDVQIRIGGNKAYTDGQTIHMPMVEGVEKNIIWGYLAHEAAHVKWTDFTVKARNKHEHVLVNALEDVRIERCMMNEYPGTVFTLNALDKYLISEGQHGVGGTPYAIIVQAALYWGMLNIAKKDFFQQLDCQARSEVENTFGKEFYVDFYNLLEKNFPKAESTSEIIDLAQKIIDLAKQYSDNSDANASTSTDADTDANTNADVGAGANVGTDTAAVNDVDANASADTTGTDVGTDTEADTTVGADADTIADANANAGAKSTPNPFKDVVYPQDHDLEEDRLSSLRQSFADSTTYETPLVIGVSEEKSLSETCEMEEPSFSINQLQISFRRIIEAKKRTKIRKKRAGRRFSAQDVTKLKSGNTKIFRHKTDTIGTNTAIHLLVDSSQSMMAFERYLIANEAAYAIARALYAIKGVNPGVSFFGPWQEDVHAALRHGDAPKKDNFQVVPYGSTPLTEALYLATHSLVKTKNSRKAILVLTDGEPNDFQSAKKALDLMKRNNIDVYAIGIELPFSQDRFWKLFEKGQIISHIDELPKAIFNIAGDLIIS